jgi:hypothetical protein
VLNLKPKKTRKLQPFQAYSRLYYKKKPIIKTTIDERWSNHLIAHPEDNKPGPRLRFRNEILRELLAGETDEVKAEVNRRRDDGSLGTDDDSDGEENMEGDPPEQETDPEEAKRRAQAEQYQSYVGHHATRAVLTRP